MHDELLDLEGALGRLDGDRELLAELVQFFLEDSPGLLEQVRGGLRSGDAKTVQRAAHSLTGLAGNFGARKAVDAASSVEQFGQSGDLAAAAAALPQLERQVGLLQKALISYRRSSGFLDWQGP